jgi:hypothetical protein
MNLKILAPPPFKHSRPNLLPIHPIGKKWPSMLLFAKSQTTLVATEDMPGGAGLVGLTALPTKISRLNKDTF